MKLLITGSTGMAGSEVIRQAIADERITTIYALARKSLQIIHPKLHTIVHTDFLNYKGLENYFKESDACIWCLGISQLQASKEQLALTTVDYTVAGAKAMLAANPAISFVFLSGNGADRNEKSKIPFARLKGKAENELLKLSFKNLAIARPDAIWPKHKHTTAPFVYKLAFPFYPLVELLAPSKIIKSDVLARALIHLAKNKLNKNTFENMELRKMVQQ
jgi:nucleoside-diphosphate-sugar epimerase